MPGDTARLSAISPGFSNFPVEFRLNLRVMCIPFGEIFFSVVLTLGNSNHTIKQSSGLYLQCVVLLGVSYMWRFGNMAIRGSLTVANTEKLSILMGWLQFSACSLILLKGDLQTGHLYGGIFLYVRKSYLWSVSEFHQHMNYYTVHINIYK